MATQSDLRLLYVAQYLRKNPMYILHNLLDLCRCSKIHLKTTYTRLLSRQLSTPPVATKMALQLLQDTAAAQAGILMSAATVGPRKLAIRGSHPKHTSLGQLTIVLGTAAVPTQQHL
jgi:hypothetical protein